MTKTEDQRNFAGRKRLSGTKDAAQNYLDAVGTADEHDKAEKLVAECEADVMKCSRRYRIYENRCG